MASELRGVKVREPVLSKREFNVLTRVRDLLCIVRRHKGLWLEPSKTKLRLEHTENVLTELEDALLSAEPHLNARLANIVIRTNTSQLVKCLCVEQGSPQGARDACYADREVFMKAMFRIVSDICEMWTFMTNDDAKRYGVSVDVFGRELRSMLDRVTNTRLDTDIEAADY